MFSGVLHSMRQDFGVSATTQLKFDCTTKIPPVDTQTSIVQLLPPLISNLGGQEELETIPSALAAKLNWVIGSKPLRVACAAATIDK